MTILSEQVRLVSDEEILLSSGAGYATGDCDWTTKKTKEITLAEEKIVYVKVKGRASNSHGNVRVLLDDEPLLATGWLDFDESQSPDIYLVLQAGNYTFKFQVAQWSHGSAGETYIDTCYIATLNFPDKTGATLNGSPVSLGGGYNFIGVTQSDTGGNEAKHLVTTDSTPSKTGGTEFSDSEYDDIEYHDGNEVTTWCQNEGEYSCHIFRFKIDENPENITRIAFFIASEAYPATDIFLWHATSGWIQKVNDGSSAPYTFDLTSSISGYIDANGYLYVLVRTSAAGASNYVKTDAAWIGVSTGSETTVATKTFTAPAGRTLPVGAVNQVTCLVDVAMWAADFARSVLLNSGESLTDDGVNWKLYVDGVQVDWKTEMEDRWTSENSNWGEGSYGEHIFTAEPGTQHTATVKAENLSGAETATVNIRVLACPWIIPHTEYEPITWDISKGSTVYVTTEPLASDPTKNVKIGRTRFVTHGDATDYYYTNSGTGILESSYTFETVETDEVGVHVSGFGGCISIIGVDLR